MIRILASLAILSGTVAFLVPKDDDLSYCPEGLRPYSPHSLNPLNISLFFTGYETLSIKGNLQFQYDTHKKGLEMAHYTLLFMIYQSIRLDGQINGINIEYFTIWSN